MIGAAQPTAVDPERIATLREAATIFFAQPGPRRIAAYAMSAWGVRGTLGPPRVSDAGVCLAVAAWWPVQEWLAHKYLLHLEPKPGRPDPMFARAHRAHHANPNDVARTLLPLEVLDVAMPGNVAAWVLLLGARRSAVTGIAAYASMALVYEWIHFLVHTGYRPRSELFRKVRNNHRLHHYRNENFWFGFTLPLVDELLGTSPDAAAVPLSKTARDLFGLGARDAAASDP